MKKTYKYIALAAIALSAVACSQEDMTSSYFSDSKAVHISAQIGTNDNITGGFQSRSNPLGETAEEQVKFNIGDQISVATGSQSAVTYTLGENKTWIPETSKYLVWSSDNMLFTAYYPVGKNNASATTFTVPSDFANVKDLADADYMTYHGTLSNAEGNGITLPMERKMVRLVINTTFGNQYESGYEVSSIKIHTNSTGYAGQDKVQSGNKEVTAYKHDDGKFYALLAPTSADASAAFLTVTVNGIAEELTVKGIPTTIAGYSYEMNLTVGKDKASVKSVKVSDWKNGTIIGGEAIEDFIYDINGHEFVNLGLPSGTKWATCNIGANNPEEAGFYFAWGETSIKDTYDLSHYKWYANNNYTKYTSSDIKTTLDSDDDAATMIWDQDKKYGIRMPTKAEIDELTNNCEIKWIDNSSDGNKLSGYKFTSKKNGMSIFLPAAGVRLNDTSYRYGSSGQYWSSSFAPSYCERAQYLLFDSSKCYWSSQFRYRGKSVRAVCQ